MLVLEMIGHGDERSSYETAGMTRPGHPGTSTNSLHWASNWVNPALCGWVCYHNTGNLPIIY